MRSVHQDGYTSPRSNSRRIRRLLPAPASSTSAKARSKKVSVLAWPLPVVKAKATMTTDQDFQRFIEQLDRPAEEPSPDASSTRPEQPTTTPLIEHLRAQRKSASSAGASQKRQIATKVLAKGQNAARSSASASQQSGTSGAPKAAAQSQPKSTAREPPSDKSSQPRKAKQGRPAQAPQPSNPLPSVAAPDAAATGSASAKQPKPHGRERKKGPHRRDPSSQKLPAASEASPAPANTPKAESSGSATRPEPKPTTVRRDPRRNNAAPPAPLASERTPGSSDTPAPAPTTSSRSHRAEADDSAGARRRLGNALAGIGGGQQRRRRGNAQDAASRDPGASAQPPPR